MTVALLRVHTFAASLQVEHETPLTGVCVSADGAQILASTNGCIGALDMRTKKYSTLLRAHSSAVRCALVDETRNQLITASFDESIRVWDMVSAGSLCFFNVPTNN